MPEPDLPKHLTYDALPLPAAAGAPRSPPARVYHPVPPPAPRRSWKPTALLLLLAASGVLAWQQGLLVLPVSLPAVLPAAAAAPWWEGSWVNADDASGVPAVTLRRQGEEIVGQVTLPLTDKYLQRQTVAGRCSASGGVLFRLTRPGPGAATDHYLLYPEDPGSAGLYKLADPQAAHRLTRGEGVLIPHNIATQHEKMCRLVPSGGPALRLDLPPARPVRPDRQD